MQVKIYTDGAARGNPDGPGGYGAILESKYYKLSWDIKNINTQRGRTKEDFQEKGKILYEAVK